MTGMVYALAIYLIIQLYYFMKINLKCVFGSFVTLYNAIIQAIINTFL